MYWSTSQGTYNLSANQDKGIKKNIEEYGSGFVPDANFTSAHSCPNPGDSFLLKSQADCRNAIPIPTFLIFGELQITGRASGYVRFLGRKKTRSFEKIQKEKCN